MRKTIETLMVEKIRCIKWGYCLKFIKTNNV
jgi:hypothetical protein